MPGYLILGCGFTARRIAIKLLFSGASVVCTNREKRNLAGAECVALDLADEKSILAFKRYLSQGLVVLHSIPVLQGTSMLLDLLRPFHPSRVVYLSTTGVYGAAELVDEQTATAPETERDLERVQTEKLIASGPWSSLVLRPAAIYGPHRGVHTSARSGSFRPPPGGNRIISRIHVDDLAEHVLAGLRSELGGAFPVADEHPSTSLEVAEWTAALLGMPLQLGESATSGQKKGRRVDGSAYRRALGLELRYPSYREGVPACLREEGVLS